MTLSNDALREWHDSLGAMIDQAGHPDYSLREIVEGLRNIRDEMMAFAKNDKRQLPCATCPNPPSCAEYGDCQLSPQSETPTKHAVENLALAAGLKLPLRDRAERFLRTSAPHHRSREWYKLIEGFLSESAASATAKQEREELVENLCSTRAAWKDRAEKAERELTTLKKLYGAACLPFQVRGYKEGVFVAEEIAQPPASGAGWHAQRDGCSLNMLVAPSGRVFRIQELGVGGAQWGNADDNDELCERIAAALRSDGGSKAWIACSERLPDESRPHEGYVLVWADGAVDCLAFYKGQFVNWTNPESPNVYPEYITHWMPIPPSPSVNEESK